MKILATLALSLALHLTLGWGWTLLAGAAGGYWSLRRGWATGALGVGGAWLLLVLYAYLAAPAETVRMTVALGGILGGLPGAAIPGLSCLIGVFLGTLGGGIGVQVRRLHGAARERVAA